MFPGEDKPTKMRSIKATIKYCNSGTQEERTVTYISTERSDSYELTKVYVVEFGCELIFCKSTNEFLVND
ncbi:hypothetical protein BCD64_00120 [Nostoc sp. MBR 210]|nr:hypothetical protein BCD64_00120 [Nostoc sp. MBR 210]